MHNDNLRKLYMKTFREDVAILIKGGFVLYMYLFWFIVLSLIGADFSYNDIINCIICFSEISICVFIAIVVLLALIRFSDYVTMK